MTESALFAKDFLHPSGVVLDSAELLASAVVASLQQSDRVSISMAGMPAVSSSFFNVVLRQVLDVYGREGLDRINMASPSSVLRQVFERSREAARRLPV
jgi:hypothetical protein